MKDGEHYHNQGDPEGKHSHRKLAGIILLAVIFALIAYGVAQTAQITADNNANITNVFEVVVNNTDIGCYGGEGGTCERVNGTTYSAANYSRNVYLKYHVVSNNAHTVFYVYINGTVVLWRDFTTIQADQNESFAFNIPKGANFSYFNNSVVHHVEWREYPILSGRNGTLSVNQTFITTGASFNATYDQTTRAFNSNYSAQTFPNSSIGNASNITTGTLSDARLSSNVTLSRPYGGHLLTIINPYINRSNIYKGQLHTQSTNSDGAQTPAQLVTDYKNAGYDFVEISDHNKITANPNVAGITFVPGSEVSTSSGLSTSAGHINNDFAKYNVSAGCTFAQSCLDMIVANGSMPVLNHPTFPGSLWNNISLSLLNNYYAIEVYNGYLDAYYETQWDYALKNGKKVYAVATDDVHDTTVFIDRGFVQVFSDASDNTTLSREMLRGNYYSSTGARLNISVDLNNTITVTTNASSTIDFIAAQGVVKEEIGVLSSSYTIQGNETYVRVNVTRIVDNKKAWSNPIFVSLQEDEMYSHTVSGNLSVSDTLFVGTGNEILAQKTDQGTTQLLLTSNGDGSAGAGFFIGRGSRGNASIPTALRSGDYFSLFGARGHDGAGYTGSTGLFWWYATENWDSTHHGTEARISTVDKGSVARIDAQSFTEGNITFLRSGKGIVLKSPDGTKCGFLNWTNANTFASTAITCP